MSTTSSTPTGTKNPFHTTLGSSGGSGSGGLDRHLSLWDLTAVGVGGTIGSGIFVLCGVIAHGYAGPATFLSWTIGGFAALLSGSCYAELAGKIPAAGSAYAYASATMGSLASVVCAGCLSIEYVLSASAVARSWGDKAALWLTEDLGLLVGTTTDSNNSNDESDGNVNGNMFDQTWKKVLSFVVGSSMTSSTEDEGEDRSEDLWSFNCLAFLISFVCVLLLLRGVKESKVVTNVFTVLKMALVSFMVVGGLSLFSSNNMSPLVPPEFGATGVLRGATSSFFGYIGYDEIACLAGEARRPARDLPRAILLTLTFVTSVYILAAVGLTGMQPYTEIDGMKGFPGAFRYNHVEWLAQLTAAGEIVTLPIVVLISTMAQPRLQYALARDGILPKFFEDMWYGTLVCGSVVVTVATFVPFTHLNDMISAAVLVAFSMTDSSLLLLRHRPLPITPHPNLALSSQTICQKKYFLEACVLCVNLTSFLSSLLLARPTHNNTNTLFSRTASIFAYLLLMVAFAACLAIYWCCPQHHAFASLLPPATRVKNQHHSDDENNKDDYYYTPCLPFVPCLGILVNWYLVAQLELVGIGLLVVFLSACVLLYVLTNRLRTQTQDTLERRSTVTTGVTEDQDHYERVAYDDMDINMTDNLQLTNCCGRPLPDIHHDTSTLSEDEDAGSTGSTNNNINTNALRSRVVPTTRLLV